ncbi:MAG: Uma2 family endonuclease [Chloroflexi bacterium]|nr:Uma2 family endonuclease [Chloroflexota bacterium]
MTTTTFTLADFLAIPEQQPALEFNPDGSIQQKMAPTFAHAELQAHLVYLLRRYLEEAPDQIGHVVSELRTTVGGASRLPDVGYYRGGRPRLGKAQDALRVADLVVEILSPSDDREQQRDKCRWYLDQGASAALLLDPQTEIAEYFGPGGVWNAYLGTHSLPLSKILPGLGLTAKAIFAILHP